MDALYDAIIGAVNLRQVRRTGFQAQIEAQALRQSGAVDPSALVVTGGSPQATFESFDLLGVLTGISVSAGLMVSAGTITIPWNRRANGGTFAGGLNNFALSSANGFSYIESVAASQGDEGAVATIGTYFLSTDGLTAPVSAAVNQSLAAQAFSTAYAMGPMYIGGVQLSQVVSIKVMPGLKLEVKRFDGGIYPTLCFIAERNPTIEVSFENSDAVQVQGPLFSNLGSGCAAYFRKKASGGTFVSDATAGHVKLSFAGGLTVVQGVDGQGTANAQSSIRITGLTPGAAALTGSTASAIP